MKRTTSHGTLMLPSDIVNLVKSLRTIRQNRKTAALALSKGRDLLGIDEDTLDRLTTLEIATEDAILDAVLAAVPDEALPTIKVGDIVENAQGLWKVKWVHPEITGEKPLLATGERVMVEHEFEQWRGEAIISYATAETYVVDFPNGERTAVNHQKVRPHRQTIVPCNGGNRD